MELLLLAREKKACFYIRFGPATDHPEIFNLDDEDTFVGTPGLMLVGQRLSSSSIFILLCAVLRECGARNDKYQSLGGTINKSLGSEET